MLKRERSNKETEGSGFLICTLLSPDVFRAIKSRRMGWVGHVECVGENACSVWWGYRKEEDSFGDVVVRWQCNSKRHLK